MPIMIIVHNIILRFRGCWADLGMFRRYRLCLQATGMWQAQFIHQGHWPKNPNRKQPTAARVFPTGEPVNDQRNTSG